MCVPRAAGARLWVKTKPQFHLWKKCRVSCRNNLDLHRGALSYLSKCLRNILRAINIFFFFYTLRNYFQLSKGDFSYCSQVTLHCSGHVSLFKTTTVLGQRKLQGNKHLLNASEGGIYLSSKHKSKLAEQSLKTNHIHCEFRLKRFFLNLLLLLFSVIFTLPKPSCRLFYTSHKHSKVLTQLEEGQHRNHQLLELVVEEG